MFEMEANGLFLRLVMCNSVVFQKKKKKKKMKMMMMTTTMTMMMIMKRLGIHSKFGNFVNEQAMRCSIVCRGSAEQHLNPRALQRQFLLYMY